MAVRLSKSARTRNWPAAICSAARFTRIHSHAISRAQIRPRTVETSATDSHIPRAGRIRCRLGATNNFPAARASKRRWPAIRLLWLVLFLLQQNRGFRAGMRRTAEVSCVDVDRARGRNTGIQQCAMSRRAVFQCGLQHGVRVETSARDRKSIGCRAFRPCSDSDFAAQILDCITRDRDAIAEHLAP